MSKEKPTYLMVPRKLVIAWFSSSLVLFILVLTSFQYTNYVDRTSNKTWCGIVNLFNETYEKSPPPTDTGKILEQEFVRLQDKFKCK